MIGLLEGRNRKSGRRTKSSQLASRPDQMPAGSPTGPAAPSERDPGASLVTIINLATETEQVKREPTICGQCGMALNHPREFHPFAACMMMEGCHDGNKVASNLAFVIETARKRASE